MHGRKRSEYKERRQSPEVSQKASKLRALEKELLRRHRDRTSLDSNEGHEDASSQRLDLDLSSKYLQVNPDPLWLWSDRRRILLSLGGSSNSSLAASDMAAELALTAACLRANPKSYGAWLHRKWLCLKHDDTLGGTEAFWHQELDLVGLFLSLDERNFHCWNYRYFLVGLQLGLDVSWESAEPEDPVLPLLSGPQVSSSSCEGSFPDASPAGGSRSDRRSIVQREWDFTTEKIRSNFSNFSAFHYRSKLLPLVMDSVSLDAEWDLVESAIFTEPYDQTAWWYHHFLLGQSNRQEHQPRLQQHLDQLLELKEDEPNCKWIYLGLISTAERLLTPQQNDAVDSEVQSWWRHLCELDPDRKARYQAQLVKLSGTSSSS